jgi:hypothetical protein
MIVSEVKHAKSWATGAWSKAIDENRLHLLCTELNEGWGSGGGGCRGIPWNSYYDPPPCVGPEAAMAAIRLMDPGYAPVDL